MSELVFIGNSHLGQFCLLDNPAIFDKYNVKLDKIIQIPGSSIKGLKNMESTTGLNKTILNYNFKKKIYIFHLGQVDIEFGYYYKSVLNKKKIDIHSFIDELIIIYSKFLDLIVGKVVIIGLKHIPFELATVQTLPPTFLSSK